MSDLKSLVDDAVCDSLSESVLYPILDSIWDYVDEDAYESARVAFNRHDALESLSDSVHASVFDCVLDKTKEIIPNE